MKKWILFLLTLLLCCAAALAQTVPDDAIRAAVLASNPLEAYPTCEMMAAWHQVLAEETDGDTAVVYAAIGAVAFGEVNGVFLGQYAAYAPAILTFAREDGGWTLLTLRRITEDDMLDDCMPEEACEAYDEYDEEEAEEAIRREAKAWLKAAGRRLEVAVSVYDMEEDLDDVELPEDVWQLTVGWPVGYLDKLAACRYPRDGRMVTCTTEWEPDEEDDEYGLLSYIMTDDASGEVVERITIFVTEDEAVIAMEDASGSRRYVCQREDEEIVSFAAEAEGTCGIDVAALEENLRVAVMKGIEAYN